jgi:hypothetical protein
MYEDPKGRFSIRVPPDWEKASFSTENNPAWLQLGKGQARDGEITDGVRLEVVLRRREGKTLADLAAVPPEEGLYPRLSQAYVTVRGREALYLTRGLDADVPNQVTYVFQLNGDFLAVNIYTAGPNAPEYISLFNDVVMKGFIAP